VPGTCAWFVEHPIFKKWRESDGNDLLWLTADPGCGKSVLSRALVDERLLGIGSCNPTICHFFFKDNEEQNNIATALCALLHQLFRAHEHLFERHAASVIEKTGQRVREDFEELWPILQSAVMDPSAGDVICILDALDECQESDRNKLIVHLKRFY
jgi:hypothetical protein